MNSKVPIIRSNARKFYVRSVLLFILVSPLLFTQFSWDCSKIANGLVAESFADLRSSPQEREAHFKDFGYYPEESSLLSDFEDHPGDFTFSAFVFVIIAVFGGCVQLLAAWMAVKLRARVEMNSTKLLLFTHALPLLLVGLLLFLRPGGKFHEFLGAAVASVLFVILLRKYLGDRIQT